MDENSSDLLHLEVFCNRDAPCVVRHALDRLKEISEIREDARLIASELVANAVLHSGCGAEHTIEVSASLRADRLRISVDDPCILGRSAELRLEDDPMLGGFGLRLVQQISSSWGSERANGHRVWAELALPS